MNLQDLRKVNRGSGGNLHLLTTGGLHDDSGSPPAGLIDVLETLMLAAGLNHIVQVNDCEADGDFTESDSGVFDIAGAAATGKRVGTNCMKLTLTAATDQSQYVQTLFINESLQIPKDQSANARMSWEDTRYLGFWYHAESGGHFGTAGELSVSIINNGVESTKVNVTATTGTAHQWMEIDMEAEGWTRNGVSALRFYGNSASTAEDIYIDDILRYSLSNGRGPIYGCAFPIKSGVTLTSGNLVAFDVDGAVEEAAAAVDTLGLGQFANHEATLTGDAKRSQWVFIPGVYIQIARVGAATVLGEGLIADSSADFIGVADGFDERAVFKALETGGEDGDDIFVVGGISGSYISG